LNRTPRLQWFCCGERIDRVVQRALLGGGDELAFKLLRNLASIGGTAVAAKVAPHVPSLVSLLQVRGKGGDRLGA
jgi:hypothetical protein